MKHVWLNGQFIERDGAQVSVFDAGFQHGVGLFETMLARNGRAFRPHRHLERLEKSARELLLTERLRPDPLIEAIENTLQKNEMTDARIRLTITGGDLNLLQTQGRSTQDPSILIVTQPPTPYPDAFFTEGISIIIGDGRVNPFSPSAGHKTLNYWDRIRSLQIASARGAGEVLWLSVTNHLASGAVSNIFLVKDDELLTPIARGEEEAEAVPAPVLPGITRHTVMEIARGAGRTVTPQMLSVDDLLDADEVFLTNSSWGVLPVVQVEREAVGSGGAESPSGPGPVTLELRTKWNELVEAETTQERTDLS